MAESGHVTPCSPLIGRSWMWDHRAVLAALPVGDLVLTGSHDAGAYRDYQVQYSTVQYSTGCSGSEPILFWYFLLLLSG